MTKELVEKKVERYVNGKIVQFEDLNNYFITNPLIIGMLVKLLKNK